MIHHTAKTLLEEIEAFRAETGMSATAFGTKSLNDGGFIADLRRGARSPSLKTVDRIRAFMREHKETAA